MLIICFFFNDTATTEIYPLSLHDALPICESNRRVLEEAGAECWIGDPDVIGTLRYALEGVTVLLWLLGTVDRPELHGSRLAMRSEEHTSELQSRQYLVCRLLLEKKKKL